MIRKKTRMLTKWVIICNDYTFEGGCGAYCCGGVIAPRVVSVSTDLYSRLFIYGYNIALEILLKEIEIEHAMRIGWI